MELAPVLVIVGPTASGKSALAIRLAKKLNGEIISADSRQVYRRLNIGSGKVTAAEMAGVPHHLLDVAEPSRTFSVARYQKLANQKIREILRRGKLPIIVGGTGFYIQSIVDGLILPAVKPNHELRRSLTQLSTEELFHQLKQLDPNRAEKIDRHNPHRLIRAIEIARALGHVPPIKKNPPPYRFLQLGIFLPEPQLNQKIKRRLRERLRAGLVKEVADLHDTGLSWKRLESFGLEYYFVAQYLQKKLTHPEMVEQLTRAIEQYAKRQLTWFRRDSRIKWLNTFPLAHKLSSEWLAAAPLEKLAKHQPKTKSIANSASQPSALTTNPIGHKDGRAPKRRPPNLAQPE